MKPLKKLNSKKILRQNDGQILLEYVLLIIIAVTMATFLTSRLVGRGDEPGIVIQKWSQLVQMVGQDIGD